MMKAFIFIMWYFEFQTETVIIEIFLKTEIEDLVVITEDER